jgi:hypothetical protein
MQKFASGIQIPPARPNGHHNEGDQAPVDRGLGAAEKAPPKRGQYGSAIKVRLGRLEALDRHQ